METHEVERLKNVFPFFSEVAPSDWKQVSMMIVEPNVRHPIGSGHQLEHAVFVISGSVRIFQLSETGREVTLYRVQSGEGCMLMMASILGETAFGASAALETKCELLLLPADSFKQWTVRYPVVAQFLYRQFMKRMGDMAGLLDDIAFKPVDYRIAELLLRRSVPSESVVRITHEQLAVELGTAREVVSRALKELEHSGVLKLGRGRIEMIDRGELEAIKRRFM